MIGREDEPGVCWLLLSTFLNHLRSPQLGYFEGCISSSLHISFLELYNESVFCLLGGEKTPLVLRRIGEGGRIEAVGAVKEEVGDIHQAKSLFNRAVKNRTVSSTNVHKHSSRSHMVMVVEFQEVDGEGMIRKSSRCSLVDCAGSERVAKTGASGDQLKEAQAINKSLSGLGDVIEALEGRKGHIPYRNSKLTFLLQDTLNGSSQTVVIINVSPSIHSSSESCFSLKFGMRFKGIRGGGRGGTSNVQVKNIEEILKKERREKGELDVELRIKNEEVAKMRGEMEGVMEKWRRELIRNSRLREEIENRDMYYQNKENMRGTRNGSSLNSNRTISTNNNNNHHHHKEDKEKEDKEEEFEEEEKMEGVLEEENNSSSPSKIPRLVTKSNPRKNMIERRLSISERSRRAIEKHKTRMKNTKK